MRNTRIVAFVYPDSVDVYRRIDHGNGRIEYRRVRTVVVPATKPSWLNRAWSAVASGLLHLALVWLEQ